MKRIYPKIVIPALLVLISLTITASAWAGPRQKGMRLNLTPEQAAQVFDLRHQFMNDTADLRKQMFVKRAELGQLWKADKPDEAAITAKQQELTALKSQLQEKATPMRLKLKEIAPELGEYGFGPGMGFRGKGKRGPGMGPRGMGPGSGPVSQGPVQGPAA
jgi:zinc resistance-associated protein